MPLRRHSLLAIPGRGWLALPLASALACAAAKPVEQQQDEAHIAELQGQVQVQGEQLKSQQQRIEALELKLAALAARPPAPAKAPVQEAPIQLDNESIQKSEAPPKLQTVKLHPAKEKGRPQIRNSPRDPAVRAAPPRLPAQVELKEPDEERLAELDQPLVDPGARDALAAEKAFATAVQQLNAGDYLTAQTEFLSFVAHWPKNASADNAVYYAGLARAASGDCAGAIGLYNRVMHDYPAGDARLPAALERGRCLLNSGKREAGRVALQTLIDEEQSGLEVEQAKALLQADAAKE